MKQMAPLINMIAAQEACLAELVALLVPKNVLSAQEMLDAFTSASDQIQMVGGETSGVQTVERLVRRIAGLAGAKRIAT